jgi:hypothetical protein
MMAAIQTEQPHGIRYALGRVRRRNDLRTAQSIESSGPAMNPSSEIVMCQIDLVISGQTLHMLELTHDRLPVTQE